MAEDAANYDSTANINRRSGIAAANVNQQFSNAAGQNARLLSRYGINPNSSNFARANADLTRSEALASAGASTGAAFDTMDKAIALRAGAANFGRNMPNSAAQYYALSNQGSQGAGATSSQGISNAVGILSPGLQGAGIASGAFGSAGNINNNLFGNQMAMYNSQMQGVGGLFSGLGNLAASRAGQAGLSNVGTTLTNWWNGGVSNPSDPATLQLFGWADGGAPGLVHGPGGPRDDAVPAMLSRGEFVLNEGAVKHFGLAKLHKMNEVGLKNQEARGLIRRSA
jgi:hypothetical protein